MTTRSAAIPPSPKVLLNRSADSLTFTGCRCKKMVPIDNSFLTALSRTSGVPVELVESGCQVCRNALKYASKLGKLMIAGFQYINLPEVIVEQSFLTTRYKRICLEVQPDKSISRILPVTIVCLMDFPVMLKIMIVRFR